MPCCISGLEKIQQKYSKMENNLQQEKSWFFSLVLGWTALWDSIEPGEKGNRYERREKYTQTTPTPIYSICSKLLSYYYPNQLLQLCTARTAWSDSDQAVRAMHSWNSWWLGPLWSDSVLFGKSTTLVATKCWPMETRLPRGDQWKAEKLGVFRR